MTVTLSEPVEQRLRAEAAKRGLTTDKLAEQLIEKSLPVTDHPNQPLLDLLDQWEREDATDDPVELARRRAEFEEFKRGMNENRLLSDGPNARIPYP